MTVPVDFNTRTEAVGNGVSTIFPYDFLCLEAGDMQVSINGEPVPVGHYSITGLANQQGGDVVFVAPPASGSQILMELAVVPERAIDYQNNGDLHADTLNFDFDRIWLAIRSAYGWIRRCLMLGPNDIDGQGAYRARGNRIADLGMPVGTRDAANAQWVAEQISSAAIDGAGEFVVQRLADSVDENNGSEMVGHRHARTGRPTKVSAELRELRRNAIQEANPAMQSTPYYITAMRDESDYSIVASGADADRYHHSPRIVRDASGRLHQAYSKALFHGFLNSTPEDPVDPQGVAIYRFSDDEGRTWSPEQVVAVALPRDMPDMPRTIFDVHIGVCPSARLAIVVSDIVPPSLQWDMYTGQTKYRWLINDTRGELNSDGSIAWVDKGVFHTADGDYARIYCERIKQVPKAGGGFRMAFTDYRKVSGGGDALVRSFWTSDDEFETAPVERSQIAALENSANETDFCFVDAEFGYAIARGGGEMHVTRDGGESWTRIGNSTNYTRQLWEAGGLIAPIIDTVWRGGKPYVLMGYSHRGAGPDGPRWLVASVTDLLNFENAVALGQQFTPWGKNYISGPNVSGPGGYNSAIHYPDGGLVYVDCTETGASPVTGFTRSDVRIVRTSSAPWFPNQGGIMVGSNISRLNQYNENEVPFVPRLEGAATAGTPAYASAIGYNIRIGRVAHIDAEMIVNAYTGMAGDLLIRGLPFAPLNVGFNPASIKVEVVNALAGGFPASDHVVALLLSTTNQIRLYKKSNSGNLVPLTLSDLGAAFNVRISGHYYCANEGLT